MSENNKTPQAPRQSKAAYAETARLFALITADKKNRDQVTPLFRNTDLVTYTDVSMGQFVGYSEKPEWKKDYQYNVFDPITRDKVMAILSKTGGMYEAQFFNANKKLAGLSETISTFLGALYKDSTRQMNEKEKNKLTMLTALISPKAIWYEGWRHQKRIIRDIEERDPVTGKITKTKPRKVVHYSGPHGYLIPVEDVIPGSLRERDIQEQPRMTILPKMHIDTFRRLYPTSRFPKSADVRAYGQLIKDNLTAFSIRDDLNNEEVEVATVFEKWEDKMSIIANGVLITEVGAPMPFAHKDYPLVWGGFEELSPFFIYDMPLTMKLLDMQDVSNEVLNLSLDMVWRALNEVILVKSGDGINDDTLYGGGMVSVNEPSNFNKLEFGSSFGFQSANSVMDRARRSIESGSLDAPSSGQSGTRAITAREAVIAREAALEITTLFLSNMENMERDKARLRVKNMLDRYRRPIEYQTIVGDDQTEKIQAVFRKITARDTKLDGGRRGTAYIEITEKPRSREELNQMNIEDPKEVSQTIEVSPELIRMIDFDTEIVANSMVRRTKSEEQASARAFLSDAAAMSEVFSVPYAAEEYVKAFDRNPEEALVRQEPKEENPVEQIMADRQKKKEKQNIPPEPNDTIAGMMNEEI